MAIQIQHVPACAVLRNRGWGAVLWQVARQVIQAGGPVTSGTKAEYVKFHDDKVRGHQHSIPFLDSFAAKLSQPQPLTRQHVWGH